MHDMAAGGWLLGFIGAVTMLVGVALGVWRVWFLGRAATTTGEVVAIDDSSGEFPIVRFDAQGNVVAGGRSISFRANTNLGDYPVGRKVTVRYDPQTPERAVIDSFAHLWAPSLILLAVGGLFAAFGYALTAR